MNNKPTIGIILGDPSGIGPELVSKLLADKITNKANCILIGERSILEDGEKTSGVKTDLIPAKNFDEVDFSKGSKFFIDITNGKNRTYEKKVANAESGASVLESLDYALDLAKAKKIHAINFGPMNKTSLILGGCKYNDEHEFMQEKLGMIFGPLASLLTFH
jgi:4-hydroxy-L-threonine phosphate dehydrogenase PdxA